MLKEIVSGSCTFLLSFWVGMRYLIGAQQGDAGGGGPALIVGHQAVLHQLVDTVGLHHSTLKLLILLWTTGACTHTGEETQT